MTVTLYILSMLMTMTDNVMGMGCAYAGVFKSEKQEYAEGLFPRYNGNISSKVMDGEVYLYSYDGNNRLTSASMYRSTNADHYSTTYKYDAMSNLTAVKRRGIVDHVDIRNMPEEHQVQTTAHEGYGHAYFYELRQQGFDVNPFHETRGRILYFILNVDKSIDFPLEEVKESYEANVKLLIQIKTVMKQAMQNYKNHNR